MAGEEWCNGRECRGWFSSKEFHDDPACGRVHVVNGDAHTLEGVPCKGVVVRGVFTRTTMSDKRADQLGALAPDRADKAEAPDSP